MESGMNTQREPIGTIRPIPVGLIRPFTGQPRTYFDPEALKELSESIIEKGQKTPAWIMPVYDDPVIQYELIAGERRWRACQLGGVPTLNAEIRPHMSKAQQYQESVMENFGRRDLTPIETARTIQNASILEFGENPEWGSKVIEKLAKIFVRSPAWIQQYRSLLKLHPTVQAMMEASVPESLRLKFQIAYALSNFPAEVQISLAQDVVRKKLPFKHSLAYIRSKTSDDKKFSKKGRRRPSQKFDVIVRFLTSLGNQSEALLCMSHATFLDMFEHRSPKDVGVLIKVLGRRIGQLEELQQVLINVSKAGKEDHGNNLAEWPRRA